MTGIRVTVLRTAGSVPRAAGTAMMVWDDRTEGTIGGGALEWEAMAEARRMLRDGGAARERVLPLGPTLGQCCGGSVTLGFKRETALAPEPAVPVWIWGAGHVGRAIATVVAPLPGRAVTLIDVAAARLPDVMPEGVMPIVAADLAALVPFAPPDADHLIVTHSHALDLALCDALLRRPCASIGLIGSATKRARFRKRLQALGHSPEAIARIACPIGDPALGKHPQQIAIGVAAALIGARGASAQKVAS